MRYPLIFVVICTILSSCGQKRSDVHHGKDESFSFISMTDIHLQHENNEIQLFRKAIVSANKLKPDFVITGGDNIRDALAQSWDRSDSLYRLFSSMILELDMPVYTSLGNHDVFGLYKSSDISPGHPEYGKKMYENRLANRYYSFDFKNWHFIVLDGIGITDDRQYIGLVDSLQISWFKSELEKQGREKPIAIIIHIPLLSVERLVLVGFEEGIPGTCLVTNARDIIEIMKPYNVKLVLQGHSHFLEDINYNGTHFISGGAVSGIGWNESQKKGFVDIHVDGENFSWRYVDLDEYSKNGKLPN